MHRREKRFRIARQAAGSWSECRAWWPRVGNGSGTSWSSSPHAAAPDSTAGPAASGGATHAGHKETMAAATVERVRCRVTMTGVTAFPRSGTVELPTTEENDMKSATKALNPTFARSGSVAGCRILLAALLGVGIFASDAAAWGPHGKITEAAFNTLPDAARWKAVLGNDQLKELAHEYCVLPDMQGRSFNDYYYANDYVLIRQCPQQCVQMVRHDMPEVQQTFVPYFRRALQASAPRRPSMPAAKSDRSCTTWKTPAPRPIRVYNSHTTMSWKAGFATTGSSSRAIDRDCWAARTTRPSPDSCDGWTG